MSEGCCPTCRRPWKHDKLLVDLALNVALADGTIVKLTKAEAELLSVLVDRSPNLVRYSDVIRAVYGAREPDTAANVIKTIACRVRSKLAHTSWEIKTSFGVGYSLRKVVEVRSEPEVIPKAARVKWRQASHLLR